MSELLQLTLLELVERLAQRRSSPVELMEAALERIDATRESLNAVVAVGPREALLEQARVAERRIAAGDARPLEGVPFGVKDLENVAGMVTSYGSRLFANNVAVRDDLHVARLRAAGAIPTAKTNTPEFGPTAITKNLLHGVTRSPWDLERTPGGSSGGSAAALTGAVLPLVTASDGGGSIRIPASWTGAFGLKPSHGRVPIGPAELWDSGQMGVYGPLTRTVEDAAFLLDLVAGPTPHDPIALPLAGYSYLARVREPAPSGLRIGFSPDFGRAPVQSDVAAAVEDGVRALEKLGNTIVAIEDGPPSLAEAWLAQTGFGLAGRLQDRLPGREDQIARYLLELIRAAGDYTPERANQIQRQRAQVRDWCAAVFERCDLLVTPTTPYDPPLARGPFPSEVEGRPIEAGSAGLFTMPFNTNWNPASTVRVGLSRAGLPVGMQIAGPQHRDDLVLQLSRAFERERPWNQEWPSL